MRLRSVCALLLVLVASLAKPNAASVRWVNVNDPPPLTVAQSWLVRGDYANARLSLKAALTQSADPDVFYTYLYCLYHEGKYVRLLRTAGKRRFAVAAQQYRGQILVGLALWRLGDFAGAVQTWHGAQGLKPNDDLYLECIRVAFLSAHRRERSDFVSEFSTKRRGSRLEVAFLGGLVASIRGNDATAERLFLEAHSLRPGSLAIGRALRDRYRHTANREKAETVARWLKKQQGGSDAETLENTLDKLSELRDLYPISTPDSVIKRSYYLPWPGAKEIFCGSHEERIETPHTGRGQHALDFFLPIGTPVLAARGGVVRRIAIRHDRLLGREEFETFVEIDHDDDTIGRYYHLHGASVKVSEGLVVKQGEMLALSGRTGACQSRHLHFEVVRKAKWLRGQPRLYSRWETVPVDFEETRNLRQDQITGRWLVSRNSAGTTAAAGRP